jgi:ABC-2 type transport system ATP-binding protein
MGPVGELGGVAARIPIVRWRDHDGALQSERSDRPASLVARLVGEADGEPRELEVIRPSLEDIYLDLVREAETPAGVAS